MTTNKLGACAVLSGVAGIFLATAVQAQSGVFRVYAGLAPTIYRISFDNNAPYADKTAKSSYFAANLGLTWVSPRGIYVDLSGQKSLSAKHDLWDDTVSDKQKFTRDSYTLTGGYIHVLSGGVSISGFGGYTHGKTTLSAPQGVFLFSKDIFESNGIFLGAGAGVPALGGQFSGSLAIAGMKGNWKDDNVFDNDADTTIGFSLGGAYTYKISESLGVTADLRYQQYKFDFGVAAATPTAPPYTVTEKILSGGVRLGYQF
ncbi:MAG: hypothetical protein WBO23_09760 [Burkholderiales bacterium]